MVDKQRFMEWVRAHQGALYRHACWLVGEPDVAADLVQEAFFRAWKGRKGLRSPDNPFPWLLTILRRAAFQEINHAGRQRRLLAEAQWPADASHEQQDDLIDLGRALATLDPAQRDLLLLYALHGLSYEQIASQLEVPVGTVMSRLARARAALYKAHSVARADNVVPFKGEREGNP